MPPPQTRFRVTVLGAAVLIRIKAARVFWHFIGIMSRNNGFEIALSAAVILLAVGFFAFMRWQTGSGSFSSYRISADMAHADQLNVGTDVRLAGVVVGQITRLSLLPKTYHVAVEMDIRSDLPIPKDSRLGVSGGTMSSPYLSISPGHDKEYVPPGGILPNK